MAQRTYVKFKWIFDPGREFRSEMRLLRKGLENFFRAIDPEAVFEAMEKAHIGYFDSEGRHGPYGGSGWVPMSRFVEALRMEQVRVSRHWPYAYEAPAAKGRWTANKVMHWSGRLRSSLTGEAWAGTVPGDKVRRYGKLWLEFGTRTPYARLLHSGGTPDPQLTRSGVVPPRRILSIYEAPAAAFRAIEREFSSWAFFS